MTPPSICVCMWAVLPAATLHLSAGRKSARKRPQRLRCLWTLSFWAVLECHYSDYTTTGFREVILTVYSKYLLLKHIQIIIIIFLFCSLHCYLWQTNANSRLCKWGYDIIWHLLAICRTTFLPAQLATVHAALNRWVTTTAGPGEKPSGLFSGWTHEGRRPSDAAGIQTCANPLHACSDCVWHISKWLWSSLMSRFCGFSSVKHGCQSVFFFSLWTPTGGSTFSRSCLAKTFDFSHLLLTSSKLHCEYLHIFHNYSFK